MVFQLLPCLYLLSPMASGCGALWSGLWLQSHWSKVAIAPKELIPVILAVATWGKYFYGMRMKVRCDNMAVVFAINTGRASDQLLMHLLRCLYFYCAKKNISLVAAHLKGSDNAIAHAISRNHLFSLAPQACPGIHTHFIQHSSSCYWSHLG